MGEILDITDVAREATAEPARVPVQAAGVQSALLRDSLGYFGSKVVPGFMGLISVPVFIRIIGLDEYGRFAVIVPLLMAFAGASSGWLAQGILRFHPGPGDSRARRVTFDQAVRAGTIASVLVTCVVLAAVLREMHYQLVTLIISQVFCFALLAYTVALAKFQAQLQPASVLRREIMRSAGGFVIPIALVLITGRKHFAVMVLGQALAYTLAFLPGFRFRRGAGKLAADVPEKLRSDSPSTREMIRKLWRFGWAVGLWLFLSQMFPVIDRWVIQKFASYTSAGVYASLYEIAIRSFSFLVFPITQAAHPRIMRSWNEGHSAASYSIIRHSIFSQLAIFLAVLCGVSVFAHRITRLILGFDDATAARLLPVLVVGGFLWQLALLLHKPLEIAERTGAMLAGMTAVVGLNVIACLLFIPRFGYEAAGYVLVFSALSYIAFTLCTTRFRAFRKFSPVEDY